MPLQNRVTPGGEIVADAAMGTVMGNRGRLHDEGRRIVRSSGETRWLVCELQFKGRKREVMSPRSYTELFFLDEAVALAAGHRPCWECRRPRYHAYVEAVDAEATTPIAGAADLDQRLRDSRRAPRSTAAVSTLPDGVFVVHDNDFRLLWDGALHRWTHRGYVDPLVLDGELRLPVVTPALSVSGLAHGYPVAVHASAR